MPLNKPYILKALCIAPEYHLAANVTKELPTIAADRTKSEYLDSLAEISAFQFFQSIPGIQKTEIPAHSTYPVEVWQLIPDRILLPEDQEFLKRDHARISAIAEKLIWLGQSWLSSAILDQKLPVHTWEDVLEAIGQYDYSFDFLGIVYHPAQLIFEPCPPESDQGPDCWSVYPPRWDICLTKTRTFNGGYIVDESSSRYHFKVEVWAGRPFSRSLQTGMILQDPLGSAPAGDRSTCSGPDMKAS